MLLYTQLFYKIRKIGARLFYSNSTMLSHFLPLCKVGKISRKAFLLIRYNAIAYLTILWDQKS